MFPWVCDAPDNILNAKDMTVTPKRQWLHFGRVQSHSKITSRAPDVEDRTRFIAIAEPPTCNSNRYLTKVSERRSGHNSWANSGSSPRLAPCFSVTTPF